MRRTRGYTLLEVLIVLTIISILAVVAMPVYLNYDTRAKVSEGLIVAAPIETQVATFYQTEGRWPSSNTMAGVDAAASYRTDYIDNVNVSIGNTGARITITYRIAALGANNTLVITPTRFNSTTIQWQCTGGSMIATFRPPVCRS